MARAHRDRPAAEPDAPRARPSARRSSSSPATTADPRDVDETIELVGLDEKADERVARLSGGQQRRLDVAVALIGDPELLFLDEPTTGFDPPPAASAWDVIAGLRDLGKTVFLTTHYMDEAQVLADRAAIIVGGRIVAEGPPERLGREAADDRDPLPARRTGSRPATLPLAARPGRGRRAVHGGPHRRPGAAAQRAHRLGARAPARADRDSTVGAPSLEDVYLELTERARAMSSVALVFHQFRFDQKTFWRNPASVFFTVLLPVIFLLIFATIFGDDDDRGARGRDDDLLRAGDHHPGGRLGDARQSLAISLTIDRENGVLKRTRGTPLPSWVFIAGRIGNALVVSVLSLVVLLAGRPGRSTGSRFPFERTARGPGHARGWRGGVLLPRDRAHRRDSLRGGGARDHELRRPAALLPLRRLHPRDRDPRGRAQGRRSVPDPPLLRGVLRRLGSEHGGRRLRVARPRDRRRLGRGGGADRGSDLPLDPTRRLVAGDPQRRGPVARLRARRVRGRRRAFPDCCASAALEHGGARVTIPFEGGRGAEHRTITEPHLLGVLRAALEARRGAFVDVGAYTGQTLVKLLLIEPTRRYVGFEPQPPAAAYVARLLEANRATRRDRLRRARRSQWPGGAAGRG